MPNKLALCAKIRFLPTGAKAMSTILDKLLRKVGLMRVSQVTKQLDFGHSIDKRLDEHRELVLTLIEDTDLLANQPWKISHLATQDDYLLRIFHMVYGYYPEQAVQNRKTHNVRPRPTVLGKCSLPEFKQFSLNSQ